RRHSRHAHWPDPAAGPAADGRSRAERWLGRQSGAAADRPRRAAGADAAASPAPAVADPDAARPATAVATDPGPADPAPHVGSRAGGTGYESGEVARGGLAKAQPQRLSGAGERPISGP